MTVAVERVDSRGTLLERLNASVHPVLLGSDDEAIREYFICHAMECVVGVCSQDHGSVPQGIVNPAHNECWIGFDTKVAKIDLQERRVCFVTQLFGVCFAIKLLNHDGSVVVVHEIGACRIDRMGKYVWNVTCDLIIEHKFESSVLRLTTDSGAVEIDTTTGSTGN